MVAKKKRSEEEQRKDWRGRRDLKVRERKREKKSESQKKRREEGRGVRGGFFKGEIPCQGIQDLSFNANL